MGSGSEVRHTGLIVVSGGQTGVDRAALDAALELGLSYGGWCPEGGRAEDYPEPPGLLPVYPLLRETPSADSAQRTEWNVRDSDATIVIRRPGAPASPGAALTMRLAREMHRPLLVLDAQDEEALEGARCFVEGLPPSAGLNFAGPRESQSPGVYDHAYRLIRELLAAAPPDFVGPLRFR